MTHDRMENRKRFAAPSLAGLLTAVALALWAPLAAAEEAQPSSPEVVARVNGEPITRDQLAQECLRKHGAEVLERLVNKYLIVQECKRLGITVSPQEVRDEIEAFAARFGYTVQQWYQMLREERDIGPEQYANEIMWSQVALSKIAGQQLHVTDAEIQREYEEKYGATVDARLIVVDSQKLAEEIRQRAAAAPESFGKLAKSYSVDTASASFEGRIRPIARHSNPPELEQVAFSLPDGGVSKVFQYGPYFAVLKREGLNPSRDVALEDVKEHLRAIVRDKKMETISSQICQRLQKDAKVENILNDPEKSKKMPGVAATINGETIAVADLSKICLRRHGEDVLEEFVNRELVNQVCRREGVEVTQEDLQKELRREAWLFGPAKPDGTPDLDAWLAQVQETHGLTPAQYGHEVLWPKVALQKLVADRVEVTEEDLQRGFENNYGRQAICLAIVMNNQRRAQEVWELARGNPTKTYFGDLAAEYSIEPGSHALRGEIPPIRQHGGAPIIEEEAFSLKPGEMSSIIPVAPNRFVILYCVSFTEPMDVTLDDVRNILQQDIYQKKQLVAMADYFQKLRDQAEVETYLAPTVSTAARPRDPATDR